MGCILARGEEGKGKGRCASPVSHFPFCPFYGAQSEDLLLSSAASEEVLVVELTSPASQPSLRYLSTLQYEITRAGGRQSNWTSLPFK